MARFHETSQWPEMKQPKSRRAPIPGFADEKALGQFQNPEMGESERSSGSKLPRKQKVDGSNNVSSAFDVWLERGLHSLFDDVANEPVPVELLQLIEADRHKTEDEDKK